MPTWKPAVTSDEVIMHSALGSHWGKHKYIAIKNGRYIYAKASGAASKVKKKIHDETVGAKNLRDQYNAAQRRLDRKTENVRNATRRYRWATHDFEFARDKQNDICVKVEAKHKQKEAENLDWQLQRYKSAKDNVDKAKSKYKGTIAGKVEFGAKSISNALNNKKKKIHKKIQQKIDDLPGEEHIYIISDGKKREITPEKKKKRK